MQRLVLSVVIVVLIVTVGCAAVGYINYQNTKLLGQVDKIWQKYSQSFDPTPEIKSLQNSFLGYAKGVSLFADKSKISELRVSIERLLPMYSSESDEFTAELAAIKARANEILRSEIPYWYKIL